MVAAALATALAFTIALAAFVFAEQRDDNRRLRAKVADLERSNDSLRKTALGGLGRFGAILDAMEKDEQGK